MKILWRICSVLMFIPWNIINLLFMLFVIFFRPIYWIFTGKNILYNDTLCIIMEWLYYKATTKAWREMINFITLIK